MSRNAKSKVQDTSLPPWSSWGKSSLPARCKRFIETYCIPAKGAFHGQPIKLAQWQMDWVEEILAPGVDSSAITLPRGQGKSTFSGALATWALYDTAVSDAFGGQPDIPVVAVTLRQAKKGVYGAALAFRKGHPDLFNRSMEYTASGLERIIVPFNGDGEMYPIASDVDALQGLDPSFALVDELGFIDIECWDSLLLAGGKRPRSLVVGLGTRNPEDVPNALDHLVSAVELSGAIPGFVLVDYSADADSAIDDRAQWHKANPALAAGYLRESALEQALALSPAPAFRTFRLNQKTGSQTGWLGAHGPSLWDDSTETFEMDPEEVSFIGVDKSAYGDCSAVVVTQPDSHGRWLTKARIFFPEGGAIDHSAVKDHLRDLNSRLRVGAVGFDERYFVEGAQELEDEGLPMVRIPQTPQRLVPAFSALYEDFVEGRLVHDDDPVFRAHVLGAVPKLDQSGGFTLAKGRSKVKIDAAVALGIARAAALSYVPEDVYTLDSFKVY